MDKTYRYWLAAFQFFVGSKRYSQVALVERVKELAPSIRLSTGHLNAVYRERKGRDDKKIKAGADLQEAVAKAYDLNYLEFLKLGQEIVEKETFEGKKENNIDVTTPVQILTNDGLQNINVDDFTEKFEENALKVQEVLYQQINHLINGTKTISNNRNQLEKERIQLQSILEATSDAIKVNRISDKVVLYENQAYKRLIGGSLLGKSCPGLCGETQNECYVDEVKVTGRTVYKIQEWDNRWYEIVANPIMREGLPYSAVTVIRDITVHHTKRLAAKHSEARLQNLMNYTHDRVTFFDANKQIVTSTTHYNIDGLERPTDLNSFILYVSHLFDGATEAYSLLMNIYCDYKDIEFSVFLKETGNEWKSKANAVFSDDEFIGIVIITRESL